MSCAYNYCRYANSRIFNLINSQLCISLSISFRFLQKKRKPVPSAKQKLSKPSQIKSSQADHRNMRRNEPTQFMYSNSEAMVLRSGKTINGLSNSWFGKDSHALITGDNTVNTPQHGYCNACFTIFSLFDFMEIYYKELRGEERKIHGKPGDCLPIYLVIRKKLEEFITEIDAGKCVCSCEREDYERDGIIYENICRMERLTEQYGLSSMADYAGYGRDREKYRIYHRNFFIVTGSAEDEDGLFGYSITRDFQRTKEELRHWLKYFRQEHQSVLDAAEKALLSYKKVRLNRDCIGEIMKFL